MKKTILAFLSGMVMVLFACSSELPTLGSPPPDTLVPEGPTRTAHNTVASPTVVFPSSLAAESLTGLTYRSDRRCRVVSGQWLAPCSGTGVTVLGDLDFDHMVPLANIHRSGTWQ